MEILFLSTAAFILSFLFALGGVGSAIALVPFMMLWTGIPVNAAKPTGLFVNTVSMIGASYSSFKNRRLDVKPGLPIIISFIKKNIHLTVLCATAPEK